MHLRIRSEFFKHFYKIFIFDWKTYFSDKKILDLEVLKLEVEHFLNIVIKKIRDDWPLEICEILIKNSKFWVSFLMEEEKSQKFFNSIASLMSSLISKIIHENIQSFIEELRNFSKVSSLSEKFISISFGTPKI